MLHTNKAGGYMGTSKIGDIVSRKSYNNDILFRVTKIEEVNDEFIYTLKGVSYRLQADAQESDLILFKECNEKPLVALKK